MFGTKPCAAGAPPAGLRGDEVEHAFDAAERLPAHGLGHTDLAAAMYQAVDHALQFVHRHPRAVRAALAGGALAGGGRFDQGLARCQLAHAVQDAVVGGDDVGPRACRRPPP